MTPQEWCDSMAPAFTRCVEDRWTSTYTDFVRTTEQRHDARPCGSSGAICTTRAGCYKSAYEGWYCVHEETYYAESDLEKNEDGEFVCPDCKRPVQLRVLGRGELVLQALRVPGASSSPSTTSTRTSSARSARQQRDRLLREGRLAGSVHLPLQLRLGHPRAVG